MLLTIDIGTSVFKSALWDHEGNRLSYASVPLSVIDDGIKYETDPSAWLLAFEDCCIKLQSGLKRLPDKNGGHLGDVQALVLSGNGPTLVPVFKGKNAPNTGSNFFIPEAGNARLWLNRRNTEKTLEYSRVVTELMDGFVDSCFFLPGILGIKNDETPLYHNTKFFLGCPEYLAYALTGEAKTVFPSDGFDRWFWNGGVLEKLDMDAQKFPPFIRPGSPFGLLLPSAARRFGLPEKIPVISGGPDFFAAILGSGVKEPGQICERTGSSDGVNVCTKDRIIHEKLMSYGHPVEPYWNLSAVINTTGKAIEWGRDVLGLPGFEEFFMLAKESGPGSEGVFFLPFLAGGRADDSAMHGAWRNLSLSCGRSGLANSILEGICFAIRDNILAMREAGAFTGETSSAGQLHVTGGLAANAALNQMKADITGRQVIEPLHKEAELLGLAVIGACYLGKYTSYAQASCAMYQIQKRYDPNPGNMNLYDDLFSIYKQFKLRN